tara:strand:+ start:169 stop:303 length:135 start_codon:yes stop_codon:yes gene_type:complete
VIDLKRIYDLKNEIVKLEKQMDKFIKDLILERLENDNADKRTQE